MITVEGLTKVYAGVRAVDDLTFAVESGKVTGFLGPNGAGKSTTMRMVLGLDRPTAGSARVSGKRYTDFPAPLREVGALLDAGAMHPGRTGRSHLRIGAHSNGIARSRVDEVIEQVGLEAAAGRRVKGYSLGMRQRLGIAAALLGDPPVLLFDEPVNGLDLDGVRWIRALLRGFADEGRTVLVSSHLMSEMQLIADRVVVIGRGRLIADTEMDGLLAGLDGQRVRVRSPRADDLAALLARDVTVALHGQGELEVRGLAASAVGDLAHAHGIPLHHLAEVEQSLEDAYLALTEGSVEHHGHVPASAEGGVR
ncbi:multidrug ABC transporter ATP-binding protein [Knoellia flava TL1]|uniref:ABC transporter ATP-binding protein n=2 Tax=Knoellia flava TaxID=913969 RepID=A0A8H9FVR8_9MICO|nr:ABC transporter ATP-binding protein [Knoellia flava]KGN35831.1 multidrug ABC transporter ATP-binding protein [Knoellia flava TL1]GGB80358.1 ABC transporter ATP-binding protein [Knoellia flava]